MPSRVATLSEVDSGLGYGYDSLGACGACIVRALVHGALLWVVLSEQPAIAEPALVVVRHAQILLPERVPADEGQDVVYPYLREDHQPRDAPERFVVGIAEHGQCEILSALQ